MGFEDLVDIVEMDVAEEPGGGGGATVGGAPIDVNWSRR